MRRRRLRLSGIVLAAFSIIATGLLHDLGPAVAQEEPVRTGGPYWYGRYSCVACHGARGEGTYVGPPLARPPESPFTDEWVFAQTRRPLALMADYPAEVLPDERLQAIADYMRTFRPPR